MTLSALNNMEQTAVSELLAGACGSLRWQAILMKFFPFVSEQALAEVAAQAWYEGCSGDDWKEAFNHHPAIGDRASLGDRFGPAAGRLAGEEQSGVDSAPVELLEQLAEANKVYTNKFGFIFIVCATGKSAAEMLRLLNDRLSNNPEEELAVAMGEQHKITMLRLKKILHGADWSNISASQLTTHVLDTSVGRPGYNISIRLQQVKSNSWQSIAQGVSDADGRLTDLLPPGRVLNPGDYKLVFDSGRYFSDQHIKGFYPSVEILFTILDNSHYHVPLLINPYGYSTYRGS